MVRNKKHNKSKKYTKHTQFKRKNKSPHEVINKKSIFNRYKNKQKVQEELIKKKELEKTLKQRQVNYSESEEEEDVYEQLVSTFTQKDKSAKVEVYSESESEDEQPSDDEMIQDPLEPLSDGHNIAADDHIEEHDLESDQEEPEDTDKDPFTKHLQDDLPDELLVSLASNPPTVNNVNKNWPILGNISITIPKPIQTIKTKSKVMILEENKYTNPGTVPNIISALDFNSLHIKSQLHGNLVSANKNNLIRKDLELSSVFTPLQKEIFSIVNNYQDFYYPERSFTNCDEIRFIYCLHVVNHMLKTRTKILHHNAKLSKKSDSSEEYRDQGLVRPKILIMVPFKNAAYKVVKCLIDILVPKEAGQVVNKNRFEEDFTGGELLMPKKNPKPEDYELMFQGNTDDTFRLGMTLTKKTLKLYTDFYSSDIIVASPLGLRILVGAEGEEDRDYDFLSSIEVLVIDQADVFVMQNWDHLLHIMDHFHLQPKKTHGTDFSRVRSWAVNGWTKYYRQTLLFSSIALPEFKAVMNRKCQNYAGKVFVVNHIELGTIRQVLLQVPQMFHRFNCSNPLTSVEARFDYFVKEVLPKQKDALMSHTLIYVPSYFDYVRLRNYFKKEDIGFVQICEYTKDAKAARARDMFFHTEAHFMLYSERVHFFRRFRIKGIRHIIFYQPPTYPHFYSEMCNLMQECNQNKYGGSEFNMTVTVLYSKYDLQQIAGVLGTARTSKMVQSDKTVHMYMTGD